MEQCAEYTTCNNDKPTPTEDQLVAEKKAEDDDDDDDDAVVTEAPKKEATCDMRQLKVNVKITFAKGNKGFAVKPTIFNRIPEYHSEDAILKGLRIPLEFQAAVIPPGSTEAVSVPRTDFMGNCVLGKIIDNPSYNDTQVVDQFRYYFTMLKSNMSMRNIPDSDMFFPLLSLISEGGKREEDKQTNSF